mmetsp:Transcript_4831/g.4484  ORF Transcript_4831/g.4484 Transcript_4831/m.4484 type:complete len:91 (+) Transcript_4831:494-766(+)
MKSLKNLAKSSGASSIRLWGKILGTEKDYYIAEGSNDAGEDPDEKPADFEPRGQGVNKFSYWATNSPLAEWTRLPDLLTIDIKAARQNRI